MRRRITFLLAMSFCSIIILYSSQILVCAKEVEVEEELKEKVITSRLVDPSGQVVEKYEYLEKLPSSYFSTTTSVAILDTNNILTEGNNTRATATFTSTLTGAYTNYTYAKARSSATILCDYMYVGMDSWYAQGTYIGFDFVESPSGWYANDFQVTKSLSRYEFGRLRSTHLYRATNYSDTSHYLDWVR